MRDLALILFSVAAVAGCVYKHNQVIDLIFKVKKLEAEAQETNFYVKDGCIKNDHTGFNFCCPGWAIESK